MHDVDLVQHRILHDILLHLHLYYPARLSRLPSFTVLTSSSIRIMMTGFLEGHQANGAFVAVGPPGTSNAHISRETLVLTHRA